MRNSIIIFISYNNCYGVKEKRKHFLLSNIKFLLSNPLIEGIC